MDSVGSVKVSGFALETDKGALLIDEGYAPHLAGTPEQRAAYCLAALLVHVLGVERPAAQRNWHFDGISVLPILRGEQAAPRGIGWM